MLLIALALSSILLLLAVGAMYFAKQPVVAVLGWGLGVTLVPLVLAFFPVVAAQALLLVVAALACCWPRRRPGRFVVAALAATLAAYGVFAAFTFYEISTLRQRFPYVSLAERLRRPPTPGGTLPDAAAKRLDNLEILIENTQDHYGVGSFRVRQLEELHEDAVQVFVRRAGFGFGRMGVFSLWLLDFGQRHEPAPPQPVPRPGAAWSAAALQLRPPSAKDLDWQSDLSTMHEEGVVDFVHPEGFGFLKDRRHVAGFQPHQFSTVPPLPVTRLKLQGIDLVGLVRHEEPVAYVSASLPSMEELREAPTRPLDPFEELGLKALRGGDTLFVRDTTRGLRALGAIRSVRQCIACHGGQRGDLLGAFSYTLQAE
jgi:hypothetical protein